MSIKEVGLPIFLNKINLKKKENQKKKIKGKEILEKITEKIFLLCAFMSVLSVAMITIFIFVKGSPAIFKIGIFKFILGTKWNPEAEIFGILPMILGSLYATLGAIIIGVPVGILTAVFIAEIAPKWLVNIIKPAVELLAGIPSVVYGFFGLLTIVPLISKNFGGPGNSLLAVCIILGIMILPTIISISENSIRAVPKEYKEGSLAMGASRIQTIFKVILPASKSGIMAGIVLGIGRAIGETMAVILISGNAAIIPKSILKPIRTLTANVALEMGYAFGLAEEALFATGVILFIFIIILNIILNILTHKVGE
ncbi:phosphate ABC transporter permease subunit PstC [Defluviitalea phaphyphila]|uniref:phosphate ABC transporter permease subunit PstC n=1 Tax=Defluviitalea phaphyphila TaxID=1473580 RepID=UPI000A43E4A1|nr:phosphate ABC transporter permease subunit PstC [Defluviitalea phaphyphila]